MKVSDPFSHVNIRTAKYVSEKRDRTNVVVPVYVKGQLTNIITRDIKDGVVSAPTQFDCTKAALCFETNGREVMQVFADSYVRNKLARSFFDVRVAESVKYEREPL